MRFVDYILLGLKNIWRRKSRSFLTIFAVVIGAISIIIMMSLVLGAKQIATQQLESIDGLTLISVSPSSELDSGGSLLNSYQNGDSDGPQLNDTTVLLMKQIPHVVDATPTVGVWIKSASLDGQDKKFRINILAYAPQTKVLNIPTTYGQSLSNNDLDKIVIGGELLRNFGYSGNPKDIIGKKIILYTQEYVDWGEDPPIPPQNADKDYWEQLQKQSHFVTAEIVGVVLNGPDESQNYITMNWGKRLMTSKRWGWDDAKMKEYDQKRQQIEQQLQQEFSSLQNNQKKFDNKDDYKANWDQMLSERLKAAGLDEKINNVPSLIKEDMILRSGYSSILLRVDNTQNIELVEKVVKAHSLGAHTAKGMLDEIEKIFNLIGMVIGAIGGIVLFVAALGIINNMIMATYERTREIGILRACGATKSTIRNMFIFEAATLGCLGGVIGLVISFGVAKILNMVGNSIALSQSVPITNLISFPLWRTIVGVIALTTLIGTISGSFAMRAARLDPVEALRYE